MFSAMFAADSHIYLFAMFPREFLVFCDAIAAATARKRTFMVSKHLFISSKHKFVSSKQNGAHALGVMSELHNTRFLSYVRPGQKL